LIKKFAKSLLLLRPNYSVFFHQSKENIELGVSRVKYVTQVDISRDLLMLESGDNVPSRSEFVTYG